MLELFGDPDHGQEPRITIHPRCRSLIESLSALQNDPRRPEDVAKINLPASDPDGVSDDEADACRYLIMAMAQGFTATVSKFRL